MASQEKVIKLRFMKPDEVGRVTKLVKALQDYQQMKRCPRLPTEDELRRELTHERDGKVFPNNRGTWTIVAIDTARLSEPDQAYVVGYLIYSSSYSILGGHQFYENSFFITEQYRRRGLGKKLMEFMRLHGASIGIKNLDIPVMNDNFIGHKFYKSHGAYLVNEDYNIMGKQLDD